jgi:uncharacterized protein (DUF427 family)
MSRTEAQTTQEKNKEPFMPDHSVEFVRSPKWLRVFFGGELIADSRRAILLREGDQLPVYYVPPEDVRMDRLIASELKPHRPPKGVASYWSVQVRERIAENAAWSYLDPEPAYAELKGTIAFDWDAMDAWFEEDEEVFVHARDPYKRIDVIHSSRHLRVVVAGETVAETRRPVLLFETGLPTRYYIPKIDVRVDLLVPSETHTGCAYKGTASYYSVQVGDTLVENIAWYYPFPNPEVGKIQNLVCFFNERVDALYVDGELMPKPKTPWS